MIDLSPYRIHDLSLPYSEHIAGYSDAPARTLAEDGWNAKWLSIYSHAGTHMDAPHHFEVNETTIDTFNPQRFMSRAHLIRLANVGPKQFIGLEDLGALRQSFPSGDSLLIQTDWSKKLGQPAYKDDLPRISRKLAEWCVEKKVNILGVEPPSVADVNNLEEVTDIHHILLGGDVIIVEGLTNLENIHKDEVFLMALPLKIKGGDGSPARVIALEQI